MEANILNALDLLSSSPDPPKHTSLLLSSARSVLLNPSSPPDATVRRILNALSLLLTNTNQPELSHRALHLLTDLALLHRHLSPLALAAVHPLLRCPSRLAADAVSAIIVISEHCGRSPLSGIDGGTILSLLSSHVAAVRSRALDLLRLDDAVAVGDGLRVFFRFMKDPCPLVRRAALDGFVDFVKRSNDAGECGWMEKCYGRAVELLLDGDDVVRVGAIRAVSEWGQILADAKSDVDIREQLDEVFVQLCCLVRDMDKKVRIEAFHALGKIKLVSEDILLQTLSKKILGARNGKTILRKHISKETLFSLSSAAGVYVHGLEDEYYEVRKAACESLGSLITFSIKFADDALDLLMDILNDDMSVVRLQTLNTMQQMAVYDRLKVHEKHMHMFLGMLVDVDPSIRRAARNLLRVMKMPDLEIFRSSINDLITNMETYPEDEADIFSVLFYIGKSHGNSVVCFLKEVDQEVKPSCAGELGLDRPRVAAFVVLAIAVSFFNEKLIHDIPSYLFSYSAPLFGRISYCLEDFINRDALLGYLCQCSGQLPFPATVQSKDVDLVFHGVEGLGLNHSMEKGSLQQIDDETSEILLSNLSLNKALASNAENQQNVALVDEELLNVTKLILKAAADTWPLIKSRCTEEVLRTLRACKKELEIIPVHSRSSACILAFASQYLKLIKLLTRVWEHLQPKYLHVTGLRVLDLLLEKLDMALRSLRYGFHGLSKGEEYHVLELVLLCYVLKLSKDGLHSCSTLSKLHATLSHVDSLSAEESIELSDFVKELSDCYQGLDKKASHSLPVNRLVEIFSLKQIVFSGGFKHIKAQLDVSGNDSENPLLFMPGLPVGIAFQITLYNISSNERVWLQMAMEDSFQHVFLDLQQFEGNDEVKKCTIEVPFYRAPKATSFSLRGCVGIECQFEDVIRVRKGQVGPKHSLLPLCKDIVIYLAIVDSRS